MTSRKEITSTFLLLAIGAAVGYLFGITVEPPPDWHQDPPVSDTLCPVMRVIDGDTLQVWLDGAVRTVRLLHIDTPEMGEAGYRRAAEALDALVGRGPVRLEGEVKGRLERDAFGRLLAYVYLGSRCINVEMVGKGWSEYWTKYGESRLADEFREAEASAREAGLGLWAIHGHGAE